VQRFVWQLGAAAFIERESRIGLLEKRLLRSAFGRVLIASHSDPL
jgi:hypothetical protein